jgi:hypothetical protein
MLSLGNAKLIMLNKNGEDAFYTGKNLAATKDKSLRRIAQTLSLTR